MWRVLLAAPLFVGAALWQRRRTPAPPGNPKSRARQLVWFLLPGLVFAGDLGTWHASMTIISAGMATLLANLAAVLVPIAAYFLFKERFNRWFALGALLSVFGTVLLIQRPEQSVLASLPGKEEHYALGNLLGLLTAFWYGAYQLSVKRLRRYASTLETMAWVSSVCGLCLLIWALALGTNIWPVQARGWWAIAGMTLGSQVLGQGLIAWGLGKVPAGIVSVTLLWQPLAATLLGFLVLGQELSQLQLLGMLPVLLGLFLVTRRR